MLLLQYLPDCKKNQKNPKNPNPKNPNPKQKLPPKWKSTISTPQIKNLNPNTP